MNFKKTEEQELLLASLDEWLDGCGFDDNYFKTCWLEGRKTEEFDRALVEAGFGAMGIPEEYGGTETDLTTLVLVAMRLAERGFPNSCMGNALQIDDMMTFGSEEQKKMVSDHLVATGGGMCFCLGISEACAGSDNNAMQTYCTHKDGKVIINGSKTFCTNADSVPYMLCLAKEADFEGTPISSYFIPMDAPGITVKPMHKIGTRYGSLCEVYLENVEVGENALVGKFGNGFMNIMKNFEIERLVMAATSCGQVKCAFNDVAKYANQRVQFGKPIGQFQLIQEKLAEMYIKILNMENLILQTAAMKDNGESIRMMASVVKYYCGQAAFEVADDAVQIMGGIAYTEEHRISRIWRDVRLLRIGGGTEQIMIKNISKLILKMYK